MPTIRINGIFVLDRKEEEVPNVFFVREDVDAERFCKAVALTLP